MKEKDLGFRDVAERLKVSPSLPHQWATGVGAPGRDLAILLEHLSDGEITAESWSSDPAVHEAARANARRKARLARRARSENCTAKATEHNPSEAVSASGNVTPSVTP